MYRMGLGFVLPSGECSPFVIPEQPASRPRETRRHAGITGLVDDICPGLLTGNACAAALHAAYDAGLPSCTFSDDCDV